MYAWFIKDKKPGPVMKALFMNPRCNLYEFWQMGHTQLYFRWVKNASPLYGGHGTLVSDTPFDTFLFPKAHPMKGELQWDWKPFTLAIEGVGKANGCAWFGFHKAMVEKVKINVPNMKAVHERRIQTAT